ncbi:MAG: hypothetical protein MJ191_02960 [Clostridium sp.]|nr:hypothetical protein [Clostridium sp.]
MGKTIILNLSHINIRGDVLDIGESFGVIYNIAKDIDDEVSVDYIEEENSEILKERSYDNCTIFFALSNIWGDYKRESLIENISKSIKTGGSIYIWDINKERGKLFNNKIRVILPSEKIKEFQFKNLNPMSSSIIEETKKILLKQFNIEEEKVWQDIYYIKARKK